jgi:hypothetical protein
MERKCNSHQGTKCMAPNGNALCLPGVDAPILQEYTSKCQKNSKQNWACTLGNFMFTHKVSTKKNIFCGLCKKDIFLCSNRNIYQIFFSFFHKPQKMLSFAKISVRTYNVRMYMQNFLLDFLTFQNMFIMHFT